MSFWGGRLCAQGGREPSDVPSPELTLEKRAAKTRAIIAQRAEGKAQAIRRRRAQRKALQAKRKQEERYGKFLQSMGISSMPLEAEQ